MINNRRKSAANAQPLPSISESLAVAGLMGFPWEAEHRNPDLGVSPHAAELFATGGYGLIVLPPELFGFEEFELMRRLIDLSKSPRPPKNFMEAAFCGLVNELERRKAKANPQVLVLGLCLAAAKRQKVRIETHARDLAKEAGVRYTTLLLVKRLALAEFDRWGLFQPPSKGSGAGTYSS